MSAFKPRSSKRFGAKKNPNIIDACLLITKFFNVNMVRIDDDEPNVEKINQATLFFESGLIAILKRENNIMKIYYGHDGAKPYTQAMTNDRENMKLKFKKGFGDFYQDDECRKKSIIITSNEQPIFNNTKN